MLLHQHLAIWDELQVQQVLQDLVYSIVGNSENLYPIIKKMTTIGTGEGGTMR